MSPEQKPIDDIRDDLIEIWHDANGIDGIELHQFLGCTETEYSAWFGPNPTPLPGRLHGYWRWLHARVYPASEVVCPSCETTIRARMADR